MTDGIHAAPDVVEEGGVRYLSAKCVKDNVFALGDALRISGSQHSANPRTSLRENDVLITTVGTIGNAAVVQPDILPANADRHLGILRLNKDAPVDPYYLATFLNCKYGRFQSLREATGNVQLNLFIEKIRELRVPLLDCASAVARQTRSAYAKRREAADAVGAAESRLMQALGLDHLELAPSKCYTRRFRDLVLGGRFGAEYYMPAKKRVLDELRSRPHKTVGEYAFAARQMWSPAQAAGTDKVRNFDLTDALEAYLDDAKEPTIAAEVGSIKKCLQAGDVVISRLRSYLREIAVVRASPNLPCVGSSEFIVLRPRSGRLSAETLMVFLRCPVVQTVLKWSQDGSNHPRFTEEDLLAIPLPDRVQEAQAEVNRFSRLAFAANRESANLLQQASRAVEDSIEAFADRRKS
ncbi:MAG TPA: hypothetical protein VHR45_11060 [Thermoanaerobaculia bacterium]|nr:hypothetical protein [Thermoanaerobaculia bacterium]